MKALAKPLITITLLCLLSRVRDGMPAWYSPRILGTSLPSRSWAAPSTAAPLGKGWWL